MPHLHTNEIEYRTALINRSSPSLVIKDPRCSRNCYIVYTVVPQLGHFEFSFTLSVFSLIYIYAGHSTTVSFKTEFLFVTAHFGIFLSSSKAEKILSNKFKHIFSSAKDGLARGLLVPEICIV